MTRIYTTPEQKEYICSMLEQSNGDAKFDLQSQFGFSTVRSVWVVYEQWRGMTFSAAGFGHARGYGAMQRQARKAPGTPPKRKCRRYTCGCLRQEFLAAHHIGCGIRIPEDAEMGLCDDCLTRMAGNARYITYADIGGDSPYRCSL